MAKTTIKLQENSSGEFFSEPILTREEWLSVLNAADNDSHRRQLETLLMFFRQEGHKSNCAAIGKEFAMSTSTVSLLIVNFNKFAQKHLGNTFTVENAETAEERFWPISMLGKSFKNCFEWKVRPELCAALEDFLITKMVDRYKETITLEGLDNSTSKELYKWKIITECQGKTTLDILNIILAPSCNLIEKAHMGATALQILKSEPQSICDVFDLLRADKGLEDRISDFAAAAKSITPSGKTSFGDERTAAAFLACTDPQHFAPYTSTLYEDYCKYIGVKPYSAGKKYAHFLQLLEAIVQKEQADSDLQACLRKETNGYVWSDILNAQDVLWQTVRFFKLGMPKNWLQKMYEDAISKDHWVYKDWYPEFVKSVTMFTGMFAEGQTAATVPDSTKDYFIRVPENYISSNVQGTYTYEEYPNIIARWPDIYSILSKCVSCGAVTEEDDAALSAIISPLTKKDRRAAQHRMWAGVLPEVLTTVISDWRFNNIYQRIRQVDDALPPPTRNWLKDNITLMKYFNDKVTFKEPLHRALFAWYLFDELKINDNDPVMEKYKKLLLANHNLILTGAPGTGKTYLAKKIAAEIGAGQNVKMVQFHPSYDYTDFVEGLRPKIEGEGFERVNGVFKEFCAKASIVAEKYVFIIDEINRGELSKIFGELFFSIDPGYRGTAGTVETQYQNMVGTGDPFEKGFYVPENVYIIGTMNDIDRGVESMDFAIRRRFAWAEVSAESRSEMLEELIPESADLAKKSMLSLNAAITDKKIGLSPAYHIGPAYYTKLANYDGDFESLWEYHIKGILLEYLRGTKNVDEKVDFLKTAFDAYKA